MSRSIFHLGGTNCPLFYIVYLRFRKDRLETETISKRLLLADCLGLNRSPAAVDRTEWPDHRVETTLLFTGKTLAVLGKCRHDKM